MVIRFGTDGIRGLANVELTPEVALAVGRAAAVVLGPGAFVVGRDTRRSGPLLQAALSAGLASEGADVRDVGVLPTPGVAWLSAADGVPGAVVSASHNGFADNGIKLFAAGGRKLGDDLQAAMERVRGPGRPPGSATGGDDYPDPPSVPNEGAPAPDGTVMGGAPPDPEPPARGGREES